MSILGRLFGHDTDYKRDSAVVTAQAIKDAVNAYNQSCGRGGEVTASLLDESYLAMEPIRLQTLAFKKINLEKIAYHANSEEFPDCDDFARIAHADLLRGTIAEHLPYAVAFLIVTYIRVGGGHHAANLAIDHKGKLHLFEPQNNLWSQLLSDVDYITGVSA